MAVTASKSIENKRPSARLRCLYLRKIMKATICEAAASLLIDDGFEALNMGRVAEAAEVGKGTVYRYFTSKVELVASVQAQIVRALNAPIEAIVASSLLPEEKLASLLEAWCSESAKSLRVLVATCASNSGWRDQDDYSCLIAQVASIFAEGIKRGCFRPAEPTTLAKVFVGAVLGMAAGGLFSKNYDDLRSTLSAFLDVFLHGIETQEA